MATNVDVRGVPRGECGYRSCHCLRYARSETPKCTCGHPPGLHENLTPVTNSSSTAVPRSDIGQYNAAQQLSSHSGGADRTNYSTGGSASGFPLTSAHPNESDSFTVGTGQLVGLYSGTGSAAPYEYQVGNDAQYGYYQQYYPSRPRCKAHDCNEPVFWDPTVGMFEYCTPKCRDGHLLPYEREKLNKDLQDFTDTLVKNAPPLPSPATAQIASTRDREQSSHPRRAQGAKSSAPDPPTMGKKSQQQTYVVPFSDVKSKGFGLIFSEVAYTTDRVHGWLITGVEKESAAYKLFQNDKLRLLDVVIEFEREPVFASAFKEAWKMNSFSLTVNRSISLPPTSNLFSKLKGYSFNRIFVLRSPRVYNQEKFGIGLDCNKDGVFISSVSKETCSRYSGVCYNDRVIMYAKADKQKIGNPSFHDLDSAFKNAESFPAETSLIIAIQRSPTVTRV